MEPHCSCHVRAASYLLLDADIIFLFVTATALFPACSTVDMSRVTDLAKRFEEATAYASVNVTSLETHKLSYHQGQENSDQIWTYNSVDPTRLRDQHSPSIPT